MGRRRRGGRDPFRLGHPWLRDRSARPRRQPGGSPGQDDARGDLARSRRRREPCGGPDGPRLYRHDEPAPRRGRRRCRRTTSATNGGPTPFCASWPTPSSTTRASRSRCSPERARASPASPSCWTSVSRRRPRVGRRRPGAPVALHPGRPPTGRQLALLPPERITAYDVAFAKGMMIRHQAAAGVQPGPDGPQPRAAPAQPRHHPRAALGDRVPAGRRRPLPG
jgi:hypothetical protein